MAVQPAILPEQRFQRVLVVIDSGTQTQTELDALAELAHRLQAELQGLFIEDANMMRLSEYTETTAYRLVSSSLYATDQGMLARAVRAQASRSRRLVESVTRRRQVRSSFQVRQGELVAELLAAVQAGDLIVLTKTFGHLPAVLDSHVFMRAFSESAASAVLLFNPSSKLTGAITVVYDGSAAADTALAVASDIAVLDGHQIDVVMQSSRLDQIESWQSDIHQRLATQGVDSSFLHFPHVRIDQLCAHSRRPQAGLIVLGVDQPLLKDKAINQLIDRIDCSVMLVR